MSSSRRAVWFALFFLFSVALPSLRAETLDQLQPHDYVNDYAGVLSPETIQSLNMLCGQIDHRGNAQIAVITAHTIGDEDIDDFVVKLEERWKVGSKGTDRGVLIFLAVNDHKYRIEVGYGLEGILPDGKAGDIGRTMVPYLRQQDYNSAITGATEQVAQVIAQDAHFQLDPRWNMPAPQQEPGPQQQLSPLQIIIGLVVFGLLLLLIVRAGGGGILGFILGMLMGGGGRGGFGGGGGGGGGGGDGFGGFGGGGSGGGGASGGW